MISKLRDLLFRVFFHNMSVKKYFKRKQGETSPSFATSTLRTLQVFPVSKIRQLSVYLFYYSGYSRVFAL